MTDDSDFLRWELGWGKESNTLVVTHVALASVSRGSQSQMVEIESFLP
jgi:hypothetical protein